MTLNEIATAPLTSTLAAFVLTFVGGGITYLLRPSVKLLWAQANVFSHRMHPNTDKEFLINTNLINIGKPLPIILNLRNADSVGKQIEIYPQQRFPRYFYIGVWTLIAFGFFFVVREMISFALLLLNLVHMQ